MEQLLLSNGSSYDLKMAGFYFTSPAMDSVGFDIITDKSLDEIETEFSNQENTKTLIVKRGDLTLRTYEGYTLLDNQFGITKDYQQDKQLIKLMLKMPKLEVENLPEMNYAISMAKALMSDKQALNCISVFDAWESFIGGSMEKGQRFKYQGELWKAINNIDVVLEHQYPSIDTAALYSRIDESHEGTLEDPIPYSQMMEVFKDKYYIEDGIIYLCIESSGQPLYASCKDLPRYFKQAEAEE